MKGLGDGPTAALAEALADLLANQGKSDEAERLRQFGLNPDGSITQA
jgi:hypothetical protein